MNRKHIVRAWLLSYRKYNEEADKRLLFTILNVLFKYCQLLLSLFSLYFHCLYWLYNIHSVIVRIHHHKTCSHLHMLLHTLITPSQKANMGVCFIVFKSLSYWIPWPWKERLPKENTLRSCPQVHRYFFRQSFFAFLLYTHRQHFRSLKTFASMTIQCLLNHVFGNFFTL